MYPILYPLSGRGFFSGLSDGVRGFVGSIAEIGTNIGNILA
jgi:hypothetical protein